MMKKLALSMGLAFSMVGAAGWVDDSNAQQGTPEVQFSQLHEGLNTSSGVMTDKKAVVFNTQDRYSGALATYSSDAPATIDFSSSRVLLADMGGRNTGGYSISVTSVEEFDDHVAANIQLVRPGPDCMVTQAFTNPYQFVLIQTTKEVLVSESVSVEPCG
jgi:hypothetical protein